MQKISEVETIYKAFKDTAFGALPRKKEDWPDWYKKRMEACEKCKYNTKNIPRQFIPTGRLYFSKLVGKYCCAICGCYINQKAWSKTEQCSIGETDERPEWLPEGYMSQDRIETSKWNRMELITMKSDEFNIISTDPSKYNIDLNQDGTIFDVKLTPTKFGDSTDFSFIIESNHKLEITNITAGCQCTIPSIDFVDEKHIKVSVHITTERWGVGFADKPLELHYNIPELSTEDNKVSGEVRFMFHIQITKNGMTELEIESVVKRNKELDELDAKERAKRQAEAEAKAKEEASGEEPAPVEGTDASGDGEPVQPVESNEVEPEKE